jgi:hypothetical protein
MMRDNNWIDKEMKSLRVSDDRIFQRLVTTMDKLAENPACSIPQALVEAKDIKAAYRMINNDCLVADEIIEAHKKQTIERIKSEDTILILQDTTVVDFSSHPEIYGLGYSTASNAKGLFLHSSLATTTDGVPLGILSRKLWTRPEGTLGKRHDTKRGSQPIETKESFKWIEAFESSHQGIPERIQTITLADRESDIFDLFLKGISKKHDLIVRTSGKRRIKETKNYLNQEMETLDSAGEQVVSVSRNSREKTPNREVTLKLRFKAVTIISTKKRKDLQNELNLYAVLATEEENSKNTNPIKWLILTTLPVSTLADAKKVVAFYTQRWKIERYHYVLKSGCGIEKLQFDTVKRLEKIISMYMIIAWRLEWLLYKSRVSPDESCHSIFPEEEIKILYQVANKKTYNHNQKPTYKNIALWLAKLGGFMGRKNDGMPGLKVLWRGINRFTDIMIGWKIRGEQPSISSNMGNG